MKFRYLPLLGMTALVMSVGCNKNNVDKAATGSARAYTPVTEALTTRSIGPSNLSKIDPADVLTKSFDNHQAWFNFTTADSAKASARDAWTLGLWNGTENRVILNYSVTTQASLISDETSISTAITKTGKLNTADGLITGGTFGMGDLSTFDFHRENQFVIGTVNGTNKVYLLRTPAVQVHPDTGSTGPVSVTYWLAELAWTGSQYYVKYRPVQKSGLSWIFQPGIAEKTINVSKSSSYQYQYVKFGTTTTVPVQPLNANWNLGLSAVVLKRYMSDGNSYPFALKGVVLNNNSGVQIYRVQTTSSTAGGPGPYDPNFTGPGSTDPALDNANSIETQFQAFNYLNIDDTKFSQATQEEIGQYWRYLDMGNYRIFVDRFYVIKTSNGHVYKLKFDNLSSGVTSNPVNNGIKFRYAKIATP